MKNLNIILILFLAITLASCKHKKEEYQYYRPASIEFVKKDTVSIMNQVNSYLAYFKKGDYKTCADMLYTIKDDTLHALTPEQKQKFVTTMTILSIKDVKIKYLTLRSELNNEMNIVALIKPDGDINKEEGVTHFFLNPILYKGAWYLTLLDKDAEGVEGTK